MTDETICPEKNNDEVVAPDNVLIRCPKVQFNLARISGCKDCSNFKGLADRFPGSQLPFARRFLVLCNREPTKRELMELVAIDSGVHA